MIEARAETWKQRLMKRGGWAVLCALLAIGLLFGVCLDRIYTNGLEQGVVMFVTLPMLVGFLSTLLPLPIHSLGKALLAVTFCLFESWLVFHEGMICVLMAAPLFYGFALMGALVTDLAMHRSRGTRAFVVVALPLGSLLLGPVQPNPVVEVTATVLVDASPEEVRARLEAPRSVVEQPMHWALQLFPTPLEMDGSGLEVGDQRAIYFGGGEGQPGWFVTEVIESGEQHVVFDTVVDRSHIAHWLDWQRDTLSWVEVEGGTEVSWTLEYRSELAPDWYFGPAERWAAGMALVDIIEGRTAPIR